MKIFLKTAGAVCVGLGFAGVFLPLLPTTPFLLLALYLFARSSPEYARKVLDHKLLGPYVRGYVSKQGIPLRVKATAIGVMWAGMLLSAFVFVSDLRVRLLLLVIAVAVTLHIALKKTAPRERSGRDS